MEHSIKSYRDFWNLLPVNVEANLKFAKEVAAGNPIQQGFFWGEYSKPIISWIIVHGLYRKYYDGAEMEIYAQYYEFVAGPFKDQVPKWYQLTSYKGINGEKLHSWLKRNGCRWFRKEDAKEKRYSERHIDLKEFKGYNTLKEENEFEEVDDLQLYQKDQIRATWEELNSKDQEILSLMVLEDCKWEEAWELLKKYINPKCGRDQMESWSTKLKQDSLSRLKTRAIKHFNMRYNLKMSRYGE